VMLGVTCVAAVLATPRWAWAGSAPGLGALRTAFWKTL